MTGRVLHLIDYTGGPGGAETVYRQLVLGLPRHGWESIPVVPSEGWLEDVLKEEGVDPIRLSMHRAMDVRYLLRLRGLIRETGADLVQTHLHASAVYASVAAFGTGCPVVSTFHGRPDIDPEVGVRRVKSSLLGRGRNRFVFVSRSLRDFFVGEGRVRATIPFDVIPNGIDCTLFSPGRDPSLRQSLDLPRDAPVLGAVGNVRSPKDYPTMLRAFARVRAVYPQAMLVVAGHAGGRIFNEVMGVVKELGLVESVRFLGFRDDVSRIMNVFDVFVLSSTDEGFSLATVQAMAVGLPLVATRCGGPEEIVEDGVSGHLVPVNDPGAMSEAILQVLADAERARALGGAARARAVSEFSLDRVLERYSAVYGRVLGWNPDEGRA